MAKQGKYEITGQTDVEAVESTLVEDAPVEAVEAATEAPAPTPEPTIRSIGLGKDWIHLAPPNCRPPGIIAEQETGAAGMWAKLNDGPWFKTAATFVRAASVVGKAKSGEAALKSIIAT